ncbi:MAG: GNAT family N-acetyltransferase [Gemmatimonadota bacterium]
MTAPQGPANLPRMGSPVALEIEPATADRWADVVALFGRRGACGGCWCMYWRRSAAEYERGKGRGNRDALRRLVARGATPGLLAYAGGAPVGWCAVAPREAYPRLERARVLKRIDDRPVWSVVCLFVAKKCRRRGVSVALLEAAAAFAASRGARILEGYPVEPRGAMPDAFAWTGTAAAFRAAGFREAARGSPTRPIMRRALGRGD